MTSLGWRFLVDPPQSGAANMATDHALCECCGPDEAVLRLYRWTRPTVSFGRNEPTTPALRESASRGRLSFVRRPTGGRAVLHHDELTYAAVFPRRAMGGLRQAYNRINEGLLGALRILGVPAEMALDEPPVGLDAGPCFGRPAPGEIVVGDRKLVGSAQARMSGMVLQHGSLLLRSDQSELAELLAYAPPIGRAPGAVTLQAVLGKIPNWDELTEAVRQGFTRSLGFTLTCDGIRAEEALARDELLGQYESSRWTWRR